MPSFSTSFCAKFQRRSRSALEEVGKAMTGNVPIFDGKMHVFGGCLVVKLKRDISIEVKGGRGED